MKLLKTITTDPSAVTQIREKMGCSRVVATILATRQITTDSEIDLYFDKSLSRMSSPFKLKDMDRAVERLYRAIVGGEKILCFVDYDADGVSSGAVLLESLRAFGANVRHYIPNRQTEGYGLSPAHITDVALRDQIDLILTADCGSKSADAVEVARQHGIDVIVTDHHEVDPGELPRAVAVVNPKRKDDQIGLDYLAGVGVAFYLVICLRAYMRQQGYFDDGRQEPNLKTLTDVVAIGTVADVVPLIKDNRILVSTGLAEIQKGALRPGMKALLKISKTDRNQITSTDIAFKLAPRINAASRMANADLALQLLTATDDQEAEELAAELDLLNAERKEAVNKALEKIDQFLQEHPEELERSSLVLDVEHLPIGLLGIIAGRLMEQYWKPVVVIAREGDRGKGSARSIPGFDIHKAFVHVAHTLDGFGGHELAGGITLGSHKIPLFKEAFEKYAAIVLPNIDTEPVLTADYEIGFEEITETLMDELESLQPFGASNPEPVFLARNVHASGAQVLCGAHRKMFLEQPISSTDRTFAAIHFNVEDPDTPSPANFSQVAFKLTWNHWKGRRTLQVQLIHTA